MEEKIKLAVRRPQKHKISPAKSWLFWLFILFFSFGSSVKIASAATIYLTPSTIATKAGNAFNLNVLVESSVQNINAISGVITFPADKLEVTGLNKSGSIVSLWVQEPSYSNSSGTVNFEGIVLNPGYQGAGARLLTITFRAKAAGNAEISFRSGSILANDGKGTNILVGLGKTTVTINPQVIGPQPPESETPIETAFSGVPLAPRVFSSTHPDPDKWYRNNGPSFSWNLPAGITGVNVLADRNSNTNPGTKSDGLISSYTFHNVADGIWYFHIRLRNNAGWGAITHFRFQIDTGPPEKFSIQFPDGTEVDNPSPFVTFATVDALSGIDYYKLLINANRTEISSAESIKQNPYRLPIQKPGNHTILVQAFDKAGNTASATNEFTIRPLKTPIFTDYPQTLRSNEMLTVKGRVDYPGAQVTVWLQREKEEPVATTVASDKNGNFAFIAPEKLSEGVYKIWAMVTDVRGAHSEDTEIITIAVRLPATLKFGQLAFNYLTTMITLIVLVIGIIVTIIYSWYRIAYWRRKIARITKTTKETEDSTRQAFALLREEVEKQVAKLDGKPGLSGKEKQICDKLKQSLQASEKLLEKELTNIEKQLDK